MKFKTKEDLIKEIKKENLSTNDGVFLVFNSFKERIDFYNKYKYHWDDLKEEEPEIWKKWLNSKEYITFKEEICNCNFIIAEQWFQDWLFDYCFRDVI